MGNDEKKIKTILTLLLIIALVLFAIRLIFSRKEENIQENETNSIVEEKNELLDNDTRIVLTKLAISYFKELNNDSNILNDILDVECKNDMNIEKVGYWEYEGIDLVNNDDMIKVYSFNYLEDEKEKNILIKLYEVGTTFSIYPNEYVEENGNKANLTKPIQNDNNIVQYLKDEDRTRAELYMDYYFELVKSNPEKSIELLDKKYKESFASIENYIDFANTISNKDNTIIYAERDNNTIKVKTLSGMTYTIEENDFMDFKLILDSYRVKLDNYSELPNERKAEYICDSFIQMMQLDDYNSIYNELNEEFKANNFDSYEKFVEFLTENKVVFDSYDLTQRGNTISKSYQYEITLYKSGIKLSKVINLIIRLIDNEKYEISFSIKE